MSCASMVRGLSPIRSGLSHERRKMMLTNISSITRNRWAAKLISIALGLAIGLLLPASSRAEDETMHHDHGAMAHDDMHAMHHHPAADMITRTQISNDIPDVTLIGMNGEKVNL